VRGISCIIVSVASVLLSCAGKETNKISVKVVLQEIFLDDKKIALDAFEDELKRIVDHKIKKGYKKEELVVKLVVDSKTKRGMIADIEVAMRKVNVRKVEYTALD
jgi:hypothetical protein